MLIIKKPKPAREGQEDSVPPVTGRKPVPAKITRPATDDCERLDDPNSLFWRGVWMTVF
ncbi:hypothetical protein [Sinorhizobium arboris]|uniref:hypothetical protein n=1 Tax=Sinorhizobium arboris TaxID=76745 RepID=UPI000425DC5B|nr:hypothetical protein [Sinorhizobium arboris]